MAQDGYFSCMGCGRSFKLNEVEINEYGLHDCNKPEHRMVVPEDLSWLSRLLDWIFRR